MGIYAIYGPNDCVYIGGSVNIKKRWVGHRSRLNCGRHHSGHLQGAWRLYGADAFTFVVLELVNDKNELTAAEQRWLDDALTTRPRDRIYNVAPEAGRTLGVSPSAEVRAKLSASLLGRPRDAETREKIAAAQRGKPRSTEAQRKRRETIAARGPLPVSEATRAKISAAGLGRKRSEETQRRMNEAPRSPYRVTDARLAGNEKHTRTIQLLSPSGEIVTIHGIVAFAAANGLDPSKLILLERGDAQSHKGWRRVP